MEMKKKLEKEKSAVKAKEQKEVKNKAAKKSEEEKEKEKDAKKTKGLQNQVCAIACVGACPFHVSTLKQNKR